MTMTKRRYFDNHNRTPCEHFDSATDEMLWVAQPTWGRFIVGVVAASLGVAGALWCASSGASLTLAKSGTTKPSVTPIADATTVGEVKPTTFVALRFDSQPSGSVYADGRPAELCRTPCSFDVDTTEGLARKFIVRSDGYNDWLLDVDLSGAKRDFQVTLKRITPTIAGLNTEPPNKIADPGKPTRRNASTWDKLAADLAAADKIAADTADKLAAADKAAADRLAVAKAAADKLKDELKNDKIDSSETLNPFKRKRRPTPCVIVFCAGVVALPECDGADLPLKSWCQCAS